MMSPSVLAQMVKHVCIYGGCTDLNWGPRCIGITRFFPFRFPSTSFEKNAVAFLFLSMNGRGEKNQDEN